uniref:Uncharacterized protein n=1 Tax=Arundo donax TaxID=35708 RepID=A0A0A9ALM1_ARUDO
MSHPTSLLLTLLCYVTSGHVLCFLPPSNPSNRLLTDDGICLSPRFLLMK